MLDGSDQIATVLRFWFSEPEGKTTYSQRRKYWFGKQPEFDAEIRQRFLSTYEQAAVGKLDDWQQSALGSLALIIVLDQFPRNLFRDSPKAFATDAKALAVAQQTLDRKFDQQLSSLQRIFAYLPFKHSEDIEQQERSVALSRQLSQDDPELFDTFDYAERHHRVIQRFGRFPHRNRILGRESTAEETEFLKQPGSSF